jgi:hypothetical protein
MCSCKESEERVGNKKAGTVPALRVRAKDE